MGAWPSFEFISITPSWCGQSSRLAPRFPSVIPAPCCPQSLFISCASAKSALRQITYALPLNSSRSLLQHHLSVRPFLASCPEPQCPLLAIENSAILHPSNCPTTLITTVTDETCLFLCLMNDISFLLICLMNDKHACINFLINFYWNIDALQCFYCTAK